ncbi:helix-turn-helix domain-containing protein [Sphaerisporangium aureirubrum]|uniref:Helix-turn-helix domain-containing protein n=1 Tax=Sphaerisporangium aureirubrum TaxID=1544736 RepID=A0ABW1NM68_9ACTN
MASRTSPTVRRRRLAAELRRLRQASGRTREEVAEWVGCAPATVTKIENGSATARPADVSLLLELYDVTGAPRDELMTLAREARRRGWWHQYADTFHPGFEVYVGLEEEAARIRSYQAEVVGGLLQTEAYARALFAAELPAVPEDAVARQVAVRLKRQERLTAGDPPRTCAVLNEAALWREVGGRATMREQLRHLVKVSGIAGTTVQVLPFAAGSHPGMHGAFTVLGFPEDGDADVVYVEYRQGSLYLEKQADKEAYVRLFDHLRARALGPEESRALISRVADQMT